MEGLAPEPRIDTSRVLIARKLWIFGWQFLRFLVDSTMNQTHRSTANYKADAVTSNDGRYFRGAKHKRPLHKIAKIEPPPSLSAKCSLSTLPQPPCPCGHTIIFKKSFAKKCRMCTSGKPPPTVSLQNVCMDKPSSLLGEEMFYGQPQIHNCAFW